MSNSSNLTHERDLTDDDFYEYDPSEYYDLDPNGIDEQIEDTDAEIDECTHVSNDDFLTAIFGSTFTTAHPIVCSKRGDPDFGGWVARPWPCDTSDQGQNWYFLPGLNDPDPTGQFLAKKGLVRQVYAIVVDDVGTKVSADRFSDCQPSWSIETSPGNFQYGFIFSEPITDLSSVEQLKSDLISSKLCDGGATGARARWSRLPVGINGRPKYGNPSPRCKLTQWHPRRKYSIDDLYSKLNIRGVTAKTIDSNKSEVIASAVKGLSATSSEILQKLKSEGLYKKSLGDGKHDITCPWVLQHTDAADNGAAYFEPSAEYPGGGFKCHHSHGSRFNINDLKKFLGVSNVLLHESTCNSPRKLPSALLPVPELDLNYLPSSIKDAVADISDRLQCPPDYLAVAMLSAAGTVIGNRVGIFPYANDESWEVYPALWGGIVGDPGSKKTPSLQAAHHPVAHLENAAAQRYAHEMQIYVSALAQYEDDLASWKRSKSKGVKPIPPTEPKRERFIVHDTTYQALGVILADNPRGVMALADELSGLLQSLDTAGQEAARGFYLSGWSGNGRYSFDRIGRGAITLDRYCLSVFGGFQPDRIRGYVQHSQRGSSKNDGLIQRFQLLVWPDAVTNPTLVDRQPDQAALMGYYQAVITLQSRISAGISGAKRLQNGSQVLHFSDAAQQVFNSWFVENETSLAAGKLDPARMSHFAKYRSLIPALAVLFHLLDGRDDSVSEDSLSKAISYAKYLRAHANRIYASVSGHDFEAVRLLASRLLDGSLASDFSCRTLMLRGWSGLASKDQAQSALDALVEYGWLTEVETKTGGRPSVRYYLNPGACTDLL